MAMCKQVNVYDTGLHCSCCGQCFFFFRRSQSLSAHVNYHVEKEQRSHVDIFHLDLCMFPEQVSRPLYNMYSSINHAQEDNNAN